jgi:hypothetical protein
MPMRDDRVVLRLCASIRELPREQCAVPERCIDRKCALCGQTVHYDPRARIPLLGSETIVCSTCFDALVEAHCLAELSRCCPSSAMYGLRTVVRYAYTPRHEGLAD